MALRRTIILIALAFAVAVVSPGSALAKAGGKNRPVKGHLAGVGTDSAPGTFGAEETGVISHLGRVAYHLEGTFAPNGSGGFDLDGTVVIVTRKGRALTGTYQTTVPPFDVHTATVHLTGGTGRFADASGTWKVTDHVTQTPGGAFPNRIASTVKGHISY
jgi:hypothetical protein